MKHFFLLLIVVTFFGNCLSAQFTAFQKTGTVATDPNFHIYICFGQSNMEGASPIVEQDKNGVDDRFQVMTVSADDLQRMGRKTGEWYTATPPLCRWDNGLTPADYFGRTLVDSLPDSIKVGIVMVAMGGSGIDAFDKDNYTQYYKNGDAWQRGLMNIYGGNPYAKIIEMAKLAQNSGVIKGILLHQGETNNGQTDWPLKVKKIYYDMLEDLSILPNSIPLLAGEMLYQNQGGICWGMNSIISNLPNYIPNSHVISSDGCSGFDDFHFTNEGQKELGKRYGKQMLSLLKTYQTDEGKTVDHLEVDNKNLTMLAGTSRKVPLKAVYADGHTSDISYLATYEISNPEVLSITNGIIEILQDGAATITASYQGILGEASQTSFHIAASTFPLTNELFNPKIWENGTFDESTRTLKTGQWGFGGWQYGGIDLSDYKYIVVRLGGANTAAVEFRVFDGNSYWGSSASYQFGSKQEIVVQLKNAKKADGTALNSEHIYIAGFWSNGSSPFMIDTVFLSNSSEYDPPVVFVNSTDDTEINQLSGFHYRRGEGPSSCQVIQVSGDLLKDKILIKAPSGFEISLDSTQAFATSISLEQINGRVDKTTVYIRLKEGLTRDSYSGNFSVSSTDAITKTIKLSGTTEQGTGIENINAGAKVIASSYYTYTGQKLIQPENYRGVYIIKKLMSDGTIITSKILTR